MFTSAGIDVGSQPRSAKGWVSGRLFAAIVFARTARSYSSALDFLGAVFNGDNISNRAERDQLWVWNVEMRHAWPRIDHIYDDEDKYWLQRELERRGARMLRVSQLDWMMLEDSDSRRNFLQHEVFGKCPQCTCVYVDALSLQSGSLGRGGARELYLSGAAAAFRGRRQSVVIGWSGESLACPHDFSGGVTLGQAMAADIIVIDTNDYHRLCSPELTKKFLLLPHHRWNTPSAALLAQRRQAMEARMQRFPGRRFVEDSTFKTGAGTFKIFLGGKSDRDCQTLMAAVDRHPSVMLQIFNGGKPIAGCNAWERRCVVMPAMSREAYGKEMDDALFVAVPLVENPVKHGSGLTAMYEALHRGKIVAITDRGGLLSSGIIEDGINGFRVGVGDVGGWSAVIEHLMSGGPALLRTYERRVFDLAEARLSREAIVDELQTQLQARCGRGVAARADCSTDAGVCEAPDNKQENVPAPYFSAPDAAPKT
eukprot:TRINITY_DN28489_c0_g1_i1.p1 TRINITY_DN28489_c0_g1~~TRINITY_DN28489_c0_g1_i1.p1  ORF type:complete len:482 (+),score=73.22 TRINITY_DN28489_c0_g1_i1:155-1600(+)